MPGVVHFEIPADDEGRARTFYTSVFGWSFQVLPEMGYSLASTSPDGADVDRDSPNSIDGAICRREEPHLNPLITIDVPDIDAALELIARSGGETVRGKMAVTGSGWNAYVRDTEGNLVGLWQEA